MMASKGSEYQKNKKGGQLMNEQDADMNVNNKLTFQCSVYMGEEGINIYSEDGRVIELFDGDFVPFIPEWHVEKYKAENFPSLKCVFGSQQEIRVDEHGNFSISGPFREFAEAHTIPYLIHYILELERAKKGKATIHAAAIAKNGKGILILGKQGSGKTSIALELCRKHGYSLIGNDLVLAGISSDFGYLYGGTKIFRIRATTIRDYNQDLEVFFKSDDNDEWTHIGIIKPAEIQITIERHVVPIHATYNVHLYSSLSQAFIVKDMDPLFSRIYLYQIFSEYIRGSAIIPLIGKDLVFSNYLPSLDNNATFERRIEFINWIINNKNYKYIAGTLIDICTFIDQHITRQ